MKWLRNHLGLVRLGWFWVGIEPGIISLWFRLLLFAKKITELTYREGVDMYLYIYMFFIFTLVESPYIITPSGTVIISVRSLWIRYPYNDHIHTDLPT